MKPAGEWAADVIILVLITLYACYAFCHIIVMWKLRKNFHIAVRYVRRTVFERKHKRCQRWNSTETPQRRAHRDSVTILHTVI